MQQHDDAHPQTRNGTRLRASRKVVARPELALVGTLATIASCPRSKSNTRQSICSISQTFGFFLSLAGPPDATNTAPSSCCFSAPSLSSAMARSMPCNDAKILERRTQTATLGLDQRVAPEVIPE